MFGLALALWPIAKPQAAELQVLAGAGIAAPLREIAAQFENTSGHKLVIRFGTTPELIKMAASGPFDLGVVPVDVFRDAPTRTQFAPEPTRDVARVGIGVAVRSGDPKPDSARLKRSNRRCSRREPSPRYRQAQPAPYFRAYTSASASPRR